MKNTTCRLILFFALIAGFICGCISTPKLTLPSPITKATGSTHGGPVSAGPSVPSSPAPASPATSAIQKFIDSVTALACLGALASLALGAFLIYSGHIWAGIHFVIGGVLTPICAIWFAYHWAMVMILGVIGFGIFLIVTKFTVIEALGSKLKPEMLKVEGFAETVIAKF
jgi:hypothetical protein